MTLQEHLIRRLRVTLRRFLLILFGWIIIVFSSVGSHAVNVIVIGVIAFLLFFKWEVSKQKDFLYLILALGLLLLREAISNIVPAQPEVISRFEFTLETLAIVTLCWTFLKAFGERKAVIERAMHINLGIIALVFFLPEVLKPTELLQYIMYEEKFYKLWQIALLGFSITWILKTPIQTRKDIYGVSVSLVEWNRHRRWILLTLSLWLGIPIIGKGSPGADIRLVCYLILFVCVYRNIITKFRESIQYGARLVREKTIIVSLLHETNDIISDGRGMDEVLGVVQKYAKLTTQSSACAIFLMDEKKQTLRLKRTDEVFPLLSRQELKAGARNNPFKQFDDPKLKGLIYSSLEAPDAVIINDFKKRNIFPGSFRNGLICPLRVEKQSIGVILALNKQEGRDFSQEDSYVIGALAEQAALSIDNARMRTQSKERKKLEQELQRARQVQELLLPLAPPTVEGFDISAFGEAAMEIGGDYYDYMWVGKQKLGLVISDVIGKGISGAMIMAMARTMLRKEVIDNFSPRDVLVRLSRHIASDFRPDFFMTMIYGILDTSTREFTFCRAGHEPIIHYSAGEKKASLLETAGIAIGLDAQVFEKELQEHTIGLSEGDMVLMYTDGFVEVMNEEKQTYGRERLCEAAAQKHGCTASVFITDVLADLLEFSGQETWQLDDMAAIVIKAVPGGAQGTKFTFSLPRQ